MSDRRLSIVLLVGLLSTAAIGLTGQSQGADRRALVETAAQQHALPSLSVAVGTSGKPVVAFATGLADLENRVAATVQSVYRIGSVSKTISAVAALQLFEHGTLDLDAPVQRYCPAFPPKGQAVTPRQLLAHLGGIRDYNYQKFAEEFLSARRYPTIQDALGVFKNDPLAGEPGKTYRYSSFGFVLLGCVIEGASETSYERYVREHILTPSGMAATRLDVPEALEPFRARPYSRNKDNTFANSPFVDLSDRFPAGGWLSTPEDLVRFGLSVLGDRLIRTSTRQMMWTRQKTSAGDVIEYGLGWRVSADSREVFHGGTSVGSSAYLYIAPDTGTVVAFATNVDLWTGGRHELARALLTAGF